VRAGDFERVPRQAQRLLHRPSGGRAIPVDFVPFGGVAAPDETIAWPPEGDFVMNVAGFSEALESSLRVALGPGLILRAASLPGLAILKLVAWSDRGHQTNKDAVDFWALLESYAATGNEDRLYDRHLDELERCEFDLDRAGAALLGWDARELAGPVARARIAEVLADSTAVDRLVSQMSRGPIDGSALVERMLADFRRAFLQ